MKKKVIRKTKPGDRHLDVPAEANRDKHINFLALESGDEEPTEQGPPAKDKKKKKRSLLNRIFNKGSKKKTTKRKNRVYDKSGLRKIAFEETTSTTKRTSNPRNVTDNASAGVTPHQ